MDNVQDENGIHTVSLDKIDIFQNYMQKAAITKTFLYRMFILIVGYLYHNHLYPDLDLIKINHFTRIQMF